MTAFLQYLSLSCHKKGCVIMMYPFMTLNDGTEIVHSETRLQRL